MDNINNEFTIFNNEMSTKFSYSATSSIYVFVFSQSQIISKIIQYSTNSTYHQLWPHHAISPFKFNALAPAICWLITIPYSHWKQLDFTNTHNQPPTTSASATPISPLDSMRIRFNRSTCVMPIITFYSRTHSQYTICIYTSS